MSMAADSATPSRRSVIAGLAIAGAVLLAACGDDSSTTATTTPAGATGTTTSAAGAPTTAGTAGASAAPGGTSGTDTFSGTLDAADQTSDGTTLSVTSVSIQGGDGFIAVHADLDGKPGPVVGHVAVTEGDSSDVEVKLDSPATTGAYWPMLHIDAGTAGTYEFPGPDVPVMSGSDIVMKKITLTVS